MKKICKDFRENKKDITIVLFDIFDTIILRKVHPEYIKKIWAKRLGMIFNLKCNYDEIYKLRNNLEAQLCEKNAELGFDLEFNYKSFVREFYYELTKMPSFKSSSISFNEFTKVCFDLEVQVEKAIQEVDQEWLEFVKEIKKNDITIICVSDFYLPKEMILELFQYHNISQYIDEIYVSCDYLLTKRSGRLYDKVIEELGIQKERILMVGDNQHSDFNMAKTKGLAAYLVDRKSQRDLYVQFMDDINSKNFVERNIVHCLGKKNSYDFEQFSLTLFAFIEKLHVELIKNGVKNVFFLSREGEFLKKIFDLYQYNQRYDGRLFIKSHYLIVSRKSTFLPSLKPLKEETFEMLFRQYRKISLHDFLSNLNFSNDNINKIAELIGADLENREADFPTSLNYQKLLQCSLFQLEYEHSRVEQNRNFNKYLDSYGIDISMEGLNIVDVGWKGTIQDNIFRILNEKSRVNGYYLGLVATGAAGKNNNKIGIVFSSVHSKTRYFGVYNENRALFEVLLGASHGSADGYVDKGSYVEALTYQEIEEKKLFENIIEPIQNRIQVLFINICEIMCKKSYELNKYDYMFAKNHAKMVFFPNKKQLSFFSSIYHFENFGVFEFTKFSKFQKVGIGTKVRNLKWLVKDPKGFFNAGFWGANTLEQGGIGFLRYLYGGYRYYKIILRDR